jgi:hypothetical protein
MRLFRRHSHPNADDLDELLNRPIPRFPKRICEMLAPAITDYLEEPSHRTAFYLGVNCEYLGHVDPPVAYSARTVLWCWLRDTDDYLTDGQERILRGLTQ